MPKIPPAVPLNVARQTFFPAILTLSAFTVVALWGVAVASPYPEAAARGLALALPGDLLTRLQATYPGWSRLAAGLLLLYAGATVGRLTIRYNLYQLATSLSLPLLGFAATGFLTAGPWLAAAAATALVAAGARQAARSYTNGYAFNALMHASLLTALLPLLLPETLPLLLLIPFTLLRFRRTAREATVALCGTLFPILVLCYVNWGAGGTLTAPVAALFSRLAEGNPGGLLLRLELPQALMLAALVLFDLAALLYLLSQRYGGTVKARMILSLSTALLLLVLCCLAAPSAAPTTAMLLSVPTAILLPLLFVPAKRGLALLLYLLLAALAVLNIALQ